jgi:sugar phosphate isomerase/epimerase
MRLDEEATMIQATLLHSVSYSGSWGQAALPVEEFVEKAAALGYEGVMLMAKRPHVSVLDWPAEKRRTLRRKIGAAGIKSVCIAGYTNFTADLEHREVPHREFQIRHVEELAALAADLSGSLVRIFTGYEHPTASPDAAWKIVADALRECARRAAAFGVTVGVQNHHDVACDYRSLRDLLDEIGEPNCRAMFDPWAPALQHTALDEAARAMAPLTVHSTFADYQYRPRFAYKPETVNYEALPATVRAVPFGEGMIDNAGFLRSMIEAGFRGTVAYEMCSPLAGGGSLENLDRCARMFVEFVKKFR